MKMRALKHSLDLCLGAWTIGLFCVASSLWADKTNIYWTGEGGNLNWTTVANWTSDDAGWLASPRYPSTREDIVWFGTNCADAAQTVNLDGNRTVYRLKADTRGNRAYTVDTDADSTLTIDDDDYGGSSAGFQMLDTSEKDLTFNVAVNWGALCYVWNASTNADVILNRTHTGRPCFNSSAYNGTWFINAPFVKAGAPQINGGELVLGHAQALTLGGTENKGGDFTVSLATNANMDYLCTVQNRQTMSLRVAGAKYNPDPDLDRTLTMRSVRTIASVTPPPPQRLYFAANAAGGAGSVLLILTGTASYGLHSLPIVFGDQPNPRVRFNPGSAQTALLTSTAVGNSCEISGPGSVEMTGNGTLEVTTTNSYTRGTSIAQGTIILNTNAVVVGGHGQMPDTGPMAISSGAKFDLNGFNDTIGSLKGDGLVDLGDAILTVSEGIAPGSSVGTLTVTNEGAVIISGGTNVFEITDSDAFDKVVITDGADVTLGGALQVAVPGGFSDWGQYKIFDLNGGTASGSFDPVIRPVNVAVSVMIDENNDVILTLSKMPAGTVIKIQ